MLRTALTPRFLGLLAVLLAVLAAFTWLGSWQLERARGDAAREVVAASRAQRPVDLTTVIAPFEPFDNGLSARQVTAAGAYRAEGQVLVPDRLLEGRSGYWVITPFVVDATGATLAVLRGFVTDPADAGPPPEGPRTVAGGLAPGESPSARDVPDGQLGSVDLSVLVNTWPGDLYNAFLFLESETPPTAPQLTKVPTPLPEAGLDWRNAGYALQWGIFGLFAVWIYWRMLRDETDRRTGGSTDGAQAGAGTGAGGGQASSGPVAVPAARTGENDEREHT